MVREIEAKKTRGLADIVPLHQQTLRLIDDVVVDITDCCSPCSFMDQIAKVAW